MTDRVTVLLLAANNMEIGYVRLDDELHDIDEKIHVAPFHESFDFESRATTIVSELPTLLLRYKPHIVHFSGHGKTSGEIILENDLGKRRPIGVSELTGILGATKDNIRLVFFNVCHSKAYAEAASAIFDYAIGMDGVLKRESAIAFTGAFYRTLAFGRSVTEAFESARAHINILGLPGADLPVLLYGENVNPAEPFLAQSKPDEGIESVFRRLLEGIANEVDRLTIQRGVAEGTIILDQIESESATEESGKNFFRVTVRDHQVHIGLSPFIYQHAKEKLFPSPPGIAPPLPHFIFIGRERALEEVKLRLGDPKASIFKRSTTIVRGWPGVGKTTLVAMIGRDPEIAKNFPQGVLWTSLEKKPDLLSEIARWGRELGTDDIFRAPTLKEATAILATLLRRRRMLLIVDDVWETGHILPFAEAVGEQCSLLVTTRMTQVAEDLTIDDKSIYVLPVLTEENALKLLRILAPSVVEQHQEECRELVCELECLPLALHVAGNLLRSEDKMGWGVSDLIREIREGVKLLQSPAPNDRIEEGKIPSVSALLARSTDKLDEFTRYCFAFLSVFASKPATFDLSAMKAVWEVDDPKPIVRKLVGHGLLEPVGSGRFQMHSLLIDHARSLGT
ncbi:MAG TPA: NB-ARC domain-containing protein [Blastocatellia bacterium]|nr:NB-ARC domain-containing protein [Blastocatellia bacterium]